MDVHLQTAHSHDPDAQSETADRAPADGGTCGRSDRSAESARLICSHLEVTPVLDGEMSCIDQSSEVASGRHEDVVDDRFGGD